MLLLLLVVELESELEKLARTTLRRFSFELLYIGFQGLSDHDDDDAQGYSCDSCDAMRAHDAGTGRILSEMGCWHTRTSRQTGKQIGYSRRRRTVNRMTALTITTRADDDDDYDAHISGH